MTTVNWTTDRIEMMTALWLRGVSADAIAKRLGEGATRSAVLGKLARLGVTRSQPIKLRVERTKRTRTPAAQGIPKVADEPVSPVARSLCGPRPEMAAHLAPMATLGSVRRGQCRWPLGDPGHGDMPVCGRAIGRGAYCTAHGAIGYQGRRLASLFALAGLPES